MVNSGQSQHNPSVVNAQEFVSGGNHINPVWFSLGAFLVKELINRFVGRLILNDDSHDLKKRLSE